MKKVAYLAANTGTFDDPSLSLADAMHLSGHNIGNFAFWNATRKLFDANIECMPFGAKAGHLSDDIDFVVIPAANFLNPTAELGWLADLLAEVNKPCIVVGLGAQSEHEDQIPALTEGTVRFLKEASARTPFLALRGPFSQAVCSHYGIGNTRVMGCPSIFTSGDRRLGERIAGAWNRPPEKLAIHAASIKAHVQPVERGLLNLLQLFPGSSYVLQRPVELMKLARGEALTTDEQTYLAKVRAFLAPDLSAVVFDRLLRQSGMVPYSVDSWRFALSFHSHSIGTRIHGALMSLSAGLPSICITHDTRTRELCSVLKVPNLECSKVKSLASVSGLFSSVRFDAVEFEDNRTALARQYRLLMTEAGIGASVYLRERF